MNDSPTLPPPMSDVRLPQGIIRYADSGRGDPVVFVHGMLVNSLLWRKVVPLLESRFRCITPDWPLGSHEMPMRPEADLTPPGLVRLVVDFLDALGLEQVTLVGNDTGGALCQLVAASHPDRIARMVLTSCDAYEMFPPPFIKYLLLVPGRIPGVLWLIMQPLRFRSVRSLPIGFGLLSRKPIDDEVTDAYLKAVLSSRPVRRDLVKILRGIDPMYTIEAAEQLRSFTRPVLIAWAGRDRVFPLSLGHRLASDFPNARFESIEDSYTFIPEDQPERLAELIKDFATSSAA